MVTMASWFHASVKPVSRSGGRSAVAVAAYRLGAKLDDARYAMSHDYRARSGVIEAFTLAPAGAPGWALDPQALWNAAEAAEKRKDARLAREVVLALPDATTPAVRHEIVAKLAQHLVDRYGVAVTAAIHAPSAEGDQRNHHAHILWTTRVLTPTGLGAKTTVLDEQKSGPEEVRHIRERAAWIINNALEASGSDERVTHLSLGAQGIDRTPTTHQGPAATELARRGEGTDRPRLSDADTRINEMLAELAALHAEIVAEEERTLDRKFDRAAPNAREAVPSEARDPPVDRDRSNASAPFVFVEPKPLSPRDAAETRAAGQAEPYRAAIRSGQGIPDIRAASGLALQHIVAGVRRIGRMVQQGAHAAWRFLEKGWTQYTGIGPNPWRAPDRDAREQPHDQEHER
jgi:hypothetical protein